MGDKVNILSIVKGIDGQKIADFYKKYNWLIMIVLVVYSAYKTFAPVETKIIKTEHTRTIVDTSQTQKMQATLSQMRQMQEQINATMKQNKDVKIDEIVKEIRYPDGRVEVITERKTIDKTETVSTENKDKNTVNTSSSTTNNTTEVVTRTENKTDTKTVTETSPNKFWYTMVGYQYKSGQLELGQGINLGKSLSLGVVASYKILDDNIKDRVDIGGQLLFRY